MRYWKMKKKKTLLKSISLCTLCLTFSLIRASRFFLWISSLMLIGLLHSKCPFFGFYFLFVHVHYIMVSTYQQAKKVRGDHWWAWRTWEAALVYCLSLRKASSTFLWERNKEAYINQIPLFWILCQQWTCICVLLHIKTNAW